MASRTRAFSLASLLLTASLLAQGDLGARLVAAAGDHDNWQYAFLKGGMDRVPIGELLDAVSAVLESQPSHIGSRIGSLLAPRGDEVLAAWRREPDRRGVRAVAFAAAGLDWVGLYAGAGPVERVDVDEVAAHLPPDRLVASLADARDGSAAAAAHLLRLAVRGERARTGVLTALRSREPEDLQVVSWLSGGMEVSALALGPALADDDPLVRARAVYALAQRLGLSAPRRVDEVLAADPVAAVRQLVAARLAMVPLRDEDLPRLLATIARGDPFFGVDAATVQGLPLAARAKLTSVLLDAGRRRVLDGQGPDAAPVATELTNAYFVATAALGPESFLTLLGRTQQEDDLAVVRAMVVALASQPPDPAVAARAAAMVWQLVDHADAQVALHASGMLARLAATAPVPELRDRLFERAQAIATERLGELQLSAWSGFCGTGPRPLGWPAERDAILVHAAAEQGAVGLLPLLLADLQVHLKANPAVIDTYDTHVGLVLQCLAGLVPFANEAQARELHQQLWPFVATAKQGDSPLRSTACAVVFGLFARVPDDLLASYDPWLADPALRATFAYTQGEVFAAIPAERARRVLPAAGSIDPGMAGLYLACPERLAAGWRSASATTHAVAREVARELWNHNPARVLALLQADQLPRELMASALWGRLPLATLVATLPAAVTTPADQPNEWSGALQNAILNAPLAEPSADLAALGTLVDACVPMVAFAEIERLGAFGEAGRAAAAPALRRLLADTDIQVAGQALTSAVRIGVDLQPSAGLRERLTSASWQGAVAVAAADLRFAGGDPRKLDAGVAGLAIAVSGRDVGVDVWRQLLAEQVEVARQALSSEPRLSRDSLTALLQALAGVTDWPLDLDQQVVYATLHDDPVVRAAAYAALATRDQELRARALWHHAAEFDADPQVRAAAAARR